MSSRELAEKFGVSMLTANRAINKLVEDKVLYRVQGSGTFVCDGQHSGRIVIGFADVGTDRSFPGSYASQGVFMDSCLTELAKYDCEIKYISYDNFLEFKELPGFFESMDGIVISAAYIDERTRGFFDKYKGILTVYRHEYILDFHCNQVVPDHITGVDEVFEKISLEDFEGLLVIGATHKNSYARGESFIAEALRKGFWKNRIQELYVEVPLGDSGRLAGYRLGKQVLMQAKGKLIFCTSDFMAIGMLDAMHELDINSNEVQLISCDNLEGKGMQPFGEPVLTSINYPRTEIARKSVELAMSSIRKQDKCSHIIKVPTNLIIRKTGLSDNLK
jgi:DNA-binding LacI/PurR family transcriptional regulator